MRFALLLVWLVTAAFLPLSGSGPVTPPSDPIANLLVSMVSGQFKRLDTISGGGTYLNAMTPLTMRYYDGAPGDPWTTDAAVASASGCAAINSAAGVLSYSAPRISPDGLQIYGMGGGHAASCRNDIMTFDVMAAAATCAPSAPCTGPWTVARQAGAMLQHSDTNCPPSSSNPCPPPGSYQTSSGPSGTGFGGWEMPANLTALGSLDGVQGIPSCHAYWGNLITPAKAVFGGLFCNPAIDGNPNAAEIFDRSSHTSILCHSTKTRYDSYNLTLGGFGAGNANRPIIVGALDYNDHDGTILNLGDEIISNSFFELDAWDASWPTCPPAVFNSTPLRIIYNSGSEPLGPCCAAGPGAMKYFQDIVTPSQGNVFDHVCSGDSTACPNGNYVVVTNVDSGHTGSVTYMNSSYSGTACQGLASVMREDFVAYGEDRAHGAILRFNGDGHVWKIDLHSGSNYSNMTCADLEASYSGDVPPAPPGNPIGTLIQYLPSYPAIIVGAIDNTNNTYGIWLLKP